MLNAVVRHDTPNALDMIEGAVRFEQARRIWTFALAKENTRVLNYLVSEAARIADTFRRLLAAPRSVLMITSSPLSMTASSSVLRH